MSETPVAKSDRLDSIDCLRGLVIVLMALDHTRDFFGGMSFISPESASLASPALFFTRWVTHFCAPTFVLLAGMGVFLSQSRGMTKPKLALYLITRGLWLVFLELTVVHFGWTLDWNFRQGMWQVIWAIGWSMVGLSLFIWLPTWVIGLMGCIIIGGHNYFDGLGGAQIVAEHPWLGYVLGERGWFWDLLHVANRGFRPAEGYGYFNLYPLLPWFGVMCLGYGLGPIMKLSAMRRQICLLTAGLLAIAGFIGLRWLNQYGDSSHWRVITGDGEIINRMRTVMSFLACSKYPPSLLYLLMTLGPALVLLALLEWPVPFFKRFCLTYGRVPLFFYILHLPLIHGLSRLMGWLQRNNFIAAPQGSDLVRVYLFWALVVLVLYFPCLGYGLLKKRYGGLLKYL